MKIQSLFIASTLIVMTATSVTATTFPTTTTPFSKYGQIQNVQNYSSNPFWDPSSPYNQRVCVVGVFVFCALFFVLRMVGRGE